MQKEQINFTFCMWEKNIIFTSFRRRKRVLLFATKANIHGFASAAQSVTKFTDLPGPDKQTEQCFFKKLPETALKQFLTWISQRKSLNQVHNFCMCKI
jgi:hypothetical protein